MKVGDLVEEVEAVRMALGTKGDSCWECGVRDVPLHQHHPVPRSRGGKRTITLCEPCHSKAHHRKKNMNTSRLVREGMARIKKADPNKKFGNPDIEKAIMIGRKVRQENARQFNEKIGSLVAELTKNQKLSYKALAETLNSLGVKTRRGCLWNSHNLRRAILSRGSPLIEAQNVEAEKNESR